MVMGDPKRDPRKHIVSVVYSVTADEGGPNADDDAQMLDFGHCKLCLMEMFLAGDHMEIIRNWFNQ